MGANWKLFRFAAERIRGIYEVTGDTITHPELGVDTWQDVAVAHGALHLDQIAARTRFCLAR